MVNYHENLRQLLSSLGMNVYYETFKEKPVVPCITYFELSNSQSLTGDTRRYSNITFQIKIQTEMKDFELLLAKSEEMDDLLVANGFSRSFATEQLDDDKICKIFRYNAIGIEK